MSFESDVVKQIEDLRREIERLKTLDGQGTWTSWTPTVTQVNSITVTVTYAKYLIFGNLAIVKARLALGSAGVANNSILIGALPSDASPLNYGSSKDLVGTFEYLDTGTAYYFGFVWAASASQFYMMIHNSGGGNLGQNPNFAVANGDIVSLVLVYETAQS